LYEHHDVQSLKRHNYKETRLVYEIYILYVLEHLI